jgi:hypothetical protein
MRQLTITLTALTVAAVQAHAGILDWLRGSSADPAASFQRGIARLQQHRNQIFNERTEITYDVRKTDSLIEPVVGMVKIVEKVTPEPVVYHSVWDVRLALHDGAWVISSFTSTVFRPDGTVVVEMSGPVKPDSPIGKAVQACFVSDEAAAAAAAAMSSSRLQSEQ